MKLEQQFYANVRIYRDQKRIIFTFPGHIYIVPEDQVKIIKKKKFIRTERFLRSKGLIA